MFYRKTDIEILCETLVKLVDRHDKALKKYGKGAIVPHEKAIELVMKQLDGNIEKDLNPLLEVKKMEKIENFVMQPNEKKPSRQFIGTPSISNRKRGRPPKKRITVVSGSSDDVREDKPTPRPIENNWNGNKVEIPQVEEANKVEQPVHLDKETAKPVEEVKQPLHSGIVTPQNIDSLSDQLAR